MKIKHFTHVDLDGISCYVVLESAFPNCVDVEYVTYENVSGKVCDFIESKDFYDYDYIFFTDISISTEVANFLTSKINSSFGKKPVPLLFDHHKSALYLNSYNWAYVSTTHEFESHFNYDCKACGTSLLYRFLVSVMMLDETDWMNDYVEFVRLYDTWEWKDRKDKTPRLLNDLFYSMGKELFIKKILSNYKYNEVIFDEKAFENLEIYCSLKSEYLTKKMNKIKFMKTSSNFSFGVVFAERFISDIADSVLVCYPFLDFVAIINEDTVSLRTNKNIDLSVIAKLLGGGGHKKASGFNIDRDELLDFMTKWKKEI